jgi:hypothetical protein
MTPRRAARDLTNVTVSTFGESGGEVELAAGIFLPHRQYVAEVHDPGLPYQLVAKVEIKNGQPECRELILRAPEGGPAITGLALRSITLASYLERSLDAQFPKYRKTEPDEQGINAQLVSDREVTSERRRRQSIEELLPKVVAEYHRALGDEDPSVRHAPTQAVADRLHYQRGHVSRLLSEARKRGMLGKARPGRPGEVER